MRGAVIWDFDGTLAYRPGLWSACLLEVLDEHVPDHQVERDQLRMLLRDGFPWHRPDVEHPELCAPDAWWDHTRGLLASAYRGVGIDDSQALLLARHAHERYIDGTCGWQVFDDVNPVLSELRSDGWRHVILSNHVPELSALVSALGLSALVDAVLTSAVIGYEKPHPKAFASALEECGGASEVWMVGDNPVADVAGAEAVGIPAIQVRTERGTAVERYAEDLQAASSIIRTNHVPAASAHRPATRA